MYADYWKNWFGDERPHQLKGAEIVRLSHEWKLPLDYLMEQVFIIKYDILEADTTVAYAGGYDGRAHRLNEYIPKYCQKIFEKPTEHSVGNVFYFRQDQSRGLDNMVFRVQPRPIKGYRKAFVNRMKRWINAANHWTNNGYVDGYPARILEVYQPDKHHASEKQHGKERNHSYDYILIQVPREYANIMIADGYFPAEFENFSSLNLEFPKKWDVNLDYLNSEEAIKKRKQGLEKWRQAHKLLMDQKRAEEEARKDFERYMADKRKTGVKPFDYYKYSWKPTVIS